MQTTANGTIDLNQRINNPDTAAAINRLLDRIDELEETVGTLTSMIQQAPGMAAMAGDIVDNTYRNAASHGVDLEERATVGLHLLEKLTEPAMATKLESLMDLADQLPGLAAMTGDIVDNTYREAASNGIDLEERAAIGLRLLNRLTDPQKAVQLEQALDLADQAPGMAAMVGDIVDDTYRSMAESGVDLEGTLRQGVTAAGKFSSLISSQEFNSLIESGILEPKTLNIVGSAGQALVASQEKRPEKIGLMGLLSALRDADVQKSLGFLTTFAKAFGQKL